MEAADFVFGIVNVQIKASKAEQRILRDTGGAGNNSLYSNDIGICREANSSACGIFCEAFNSVVSIVGNVLRNSSEKALLSVVVKTVNREGLTSYVVERYSVVVYFRNLKIFVYLCNFT